MRCNETNFHIDVSVRIAFKIVTSVTTLLIWWVLPAKLSWRHCRCDISRNWIVGRFSSPWWMGRTCGMSRVFTVSRWAWISWSVLLSERDSGDVRRPRSTMVSGRMRDNQLEPHSHQLSLSSSYQLRSHHGPVRGNREITRIHRQQTFRCWINVTVKLTTSYFLVVLPSKINCTRLIQKC